MIQVKTLQDGMMHELDRLADGVRIEYMLHFEIALREQFRATQSAVHVITRSLKTSGRLSSTHSKDSWSGEITYGGLSEGSIHNPVDYAEYERERGGHHDFLAPAIALEEQYVKAMMTLLRGY